MDNKEKIKTAGTIIAILAAISGAIILFLETIF